MESTWHFFHILESTPDPQFTLPSVLEPTRCLEYTPKQYSSWRPQFTVIHILEPTRRFIHILESTPKWIRSFSPQFRVVQFLEPVIHLHVDPRVHTHSLLSSASWTPQSIFIQLRKLPLYTVIHSQKSPSTFVST